MCVDETSISRASPGVAEICANPPSTGTRGPTWMALGPETLSNGAANIFVSSNAKATAPIEVRVTLNCSKPVDSHDASSQRTRFPLLAQTYPDATTSPVTLEPVGSDSTAGERPAFVIDWTSPLLLPT